MKTCIARFSTCYTRTRRQEGRESLRKSQCKGRAGQSTELRPCAVKTHTVAKGFGTLPSSGQVLYYVTRLRTCGSPDHDLPYRVALLPRRRRDLEVESDAVTGRAGRGLKGQLEL